MGKKSVFGESFVKDVKACWGAWMAPLNAPVLPHLDFYFDFLSPYAYLAFERLPQALAGLSYSISYRPVYLPALLAHWGQKGPIEIPLKRAWMKRQVDWLAQQHGVPLCWPPSHPFNPLPFLRLAQASAPMLGATPSRWVVETLFRHVWAQEGDPQAPERWSAIVAQLAVQRVPELVAYADPSQEPTVKAALTQATQEALALGVFGVPMMRVGEDFFWGMDSLVMVAECVGGGVHIPQS